MFKPSFFSNNYVTDVYGYFGQNIFNCYVQKDYVWPKSSPIIVLAIYPNEEWK